MIELPLNTEFVVYETFSAQPVKLKVLKDTGTECDKCFFAEDCPGTYACGAERLDGINVYFKKIDTPGVEVAIGDTFTVTLQALAYSTKECSLCALNKTDLCKQYKCDEEVRSDNTNVCFVVTSNNCE